MKHPIAFIIPLLFIALFWLSLRPVPVNIAEINRNFEALKQVKPVQMTYERITLSNGKKTWRPIRPPFKPRLAALEKNLADLQKFNTGFLTPCNHFRYLVNENRLQNKLLLKDMPSTPRYKNTNLEDRQKQYPLHIRTYLGMDMTPQDLIAYGDGKLIEALADLDRFERKLIAENLASSVKDYEANNTKLYTSEADIITAFEKRRPIIQSNLSKFFFDYDIPDTHVRASRNIPFAYAIGTYSISKSTFFFYWDGKTFFDKDFDYLLIHELNPGHHMQGHVAKKYPLCTTPRAKISTFRPAFSEGWATYIEALGPELGMFKTPMQQLGRLDWDLVRAIRIILDVRMHYDGWSDEQIKLYWRDHMPERLHYLSDREIMRMHKMPMQAITYKVGKDAFIKLKASEQTRLGKDFDIRKFHDTLLRMGPVPLDILEEAYAALN